MSLRIAVLGSTRGTSLQGLLDAIEAGTLDAQIVLIISDRDSAPILLRAIAHEIPHLALDPRGLAREEFDSLITEACEEADAQLILMIGYMRIVSAKFVDHWRGRLLNVHPSLLPAFAGGMNLNVHTAVLASGTKETGCTIHHVTEEVDAGGILLQKRCAVLQDDTVETLKDRVQALEQDAFVEVVKNWSAA